ncbi:MAG: hypothetical protein HY689_14400 [Chloroflexi bacterium]|nr:hypothetical protein [Chloroflexota bacterium]
MADWKAIGKAVVNDTGLWYLEVADAILDRNKSWGEVWATVWDRAEETQQSFVYDLRQAGVRHPLIWMRVMNQIFGTLYFTSLFRWPGRVLRFTAMLVVLPIGWAMGSLLLRRQAQVPRRLRPLAGVEEPHHHPLVG